MIRSIGVCSWSLHPSDPDELIRKMRAVGVNNVQLALDPLRTGQWPQARECLERLHNEGIEIASGMMAMHRGKENFPPHPVKQFLSALDLQRPNLCADGRLRAVELFRRPRETLFASHLQKSGHLIQIHNLRASRGQPILLTGRFF